VKADAHATAPDPEALAAFLRDAPEELREWAAAQLPPEAGEPVPSDGPAPVAGPAHVADSDLALAELGEDEDEPRRGPQNHTPMDKVPTPIAVPAKKGRNPLAPILGILVIAALVYGVFRVGLPDEPADQAAGQPTATASASSGAARMAELEARLLGSPDDVAVNLELGVLHFNAGDSERAEQLWTRVTELDPRNPQAWFNLGFVHLAQDPPDTEGAKADWDKVLEVAPDSDLAATVESHLDALEAMGSPTQTEE